MHDLYTHTLTRIDGTTHSLRDYAGSVLLIVNVASRCGYTPQYAALEALWLEYRAQGLVVLGFPCNQFGAQEPAGEADILTFCRTQYDITFPLYAKIDVNGPHAHPLYQHLTQAAPGVLGTRAVKWNFTKFLVDREGAVRARYAPATKPETLAVEIAALLAR